MNLSLALIWLVLSSLNNKSDKSFSVNFIFSLDIGSLFVSTTLSFTFL